MWKLNCFNNTIQLSIYNLYRSMLCFYRKFWYIVYTFEHVKWNNRKWIGLSTELEEVACEMRWPALGTRQVGRSNAGTLLGSTVGYSSCPAAVGSHIIPLLNIGIPIYSWLLFVLGTCPPMVTRLWFSRYAGLVSRTWLLEWAFK